MGDTKFRQSGRRTAVGPFRAQLKKLRREQADARNAAWRALPTAAKLASLASRPGESRRQISRLQPSVIHPHR